MNEEIEQIKKFIDEDEYTFVEVDDEQDGFKVVARKEGDSRRWSRWITIIIEAPSGKFYEWGYDEGLTEYQDSDYSDRDIREVTRREETVIKVYWDRVPQEPKPRPSGILEPFD